MIQRVDFHKQFIGNRDVVLWGAGYDCGQVINQLKEKGIYVSFLVDRDFEDKRERYGKIVKSKEVLDKNKHYVIISSHEYRQEISRELVGMSKNDVHGEIKPAIDFYDWFKLELPYKHIINFGANDKEWTISVGKASYFPFKHFCNADIGSFVSINETARCAVNHRMDTLGTARFARIFETNEFKLLEKSIHDPNAQNRVQIGNDVWIGANVVINTSKVKKIGDGAIIGTNTLVLEDVPPYAIVVGTPAKTLRFRYSEEEIQCLLRVKWWDWENEEIIKQSKFIYNPKLFFEKYM